MVLESMLSKETVKLGISCVDKWTVIGNLIDLMVEKGRVRDREAILSAVINREKQGSTGLEKGVAIPHARSDGVRELVAALGISKDGLDFDSVDAKPCHLIFLIVAPPQESTRYLKALAAIVSYIAKDEDVISRLRLAASPEEVMSILAEIGKSIP